MQETATDIAALEARGLSAGYDGKIVLNDVSVQLRFGEVLGIIGPNGSGKSTLIRSLSRTLPPESGAALLLGKDIYSLTAREAAKKISVVPQLEDPIFDFTVREIIAMGRFAWGDADPEIIDRAIEATSCTEFADRKFGQISGGERQRVLIARALAQSAQVILLDEPTAHMDVGYQIATLSLMRKFASQGLAIGAALHDLNLVAGYADRAILLHLGRIVAEGPAEDVLRSEEIERVYGASFDHIVDPRTGRLILAPEYLPERTKASIRRRVHVIGGGGTAAALITELWQMGHDVTLGATQELDSDFEAARRLKIPSVAAPPFTALGSQHKTEAANLAKDADFVIVTAAPYGRGNLSNLKLAGELQNSGKRLILIERGLSQWDYAEGEAELTESELLQSGANRMPLSEIAGFLQKEIP